MPATSTLCMARVQCVRVTLICLSCNKTEQNWTSFLLCMALLTPLDQHACGFSLIAMQLVPGDYYVVLM